MIFYLGNSAGFGTRTYCTIH